MGRDEPDGGGGDLLSVVVFTFWAVDDPMPAYGVVGVDFHFDGTFLLEDEDLDADVKGVEEALGDGGLGVLWDGELGGAADCEVED